MEKNKKLLSGLFSQKRVMLLTRFPTKPGEGQQSDPVDEGAFVINWVPKSGGQYSTHGKASFRLRASRNVKIECELVVEGTNSQSVVSYKSDEGSNKIQVVLVASASASASTSDKKTSGRYETLTITLPEAVRPISGATYKLTGKVVIEVDGVDKPIIITSSILTYTHP